MIVTFLIGDLGGFTIRGSDNVAFKFIMLLILSSFSINPHRHAELQPLVEPPFLLVNIASS